MQPVPLFAGRDVEAAVSPEAALEAVREAFVAYARGEWTMPPKVYVPAYPAGDFRAMPALGERPRASEMGDLVPGQPGAGPADRERVSCCSPMPRTECCGPHSTRARSRLCGPARPRCWPRRRSAGPGPASAAVIGAGVNGRATARTFLARGLRDDAVGRGRRARAGGRGRSSAPRVAASREEALAADLVATVTPGHELVYGPGLAAARAST